LACKTFSIEGWLQHHIIMESIQCSDELKIREQLNPINIHPRTKEIRYQKITEQIKTKKFDDILYRVILQHNQDYIDSYHHNGREAHPTNKMILLFNYAIDCGKKIQDKTVENVGVFRAWQLKKYYFQLLNKVNGDLKFHIFTKENKIIFKL
jgi:hypothetical protein